MKEPKAFKIPPHSLEAEQAVIGGLLLDKEAWDTVSGIITDADFYLEEHKTIFQAIAQLAAREQPIDVVTVTDILKEKKNKVDPHYLSELAENTASAANIAAYADIVRERSLLRKLIQIGTNMAESAFQPDGKLTVELVDHAEREIFAIAEQGGKTQGPKRIQSVLAGTMEYIQTLFEANEPITGIPTGFSDFDQLSAGLQKGDLVIIAGRPAMGKTTFAMNIAQYAAIAESKPVLIFSMEMPSEQIGMRMISSLSSINQHNLRTGKIQDEDWPRISSAIDILSQAPLYIDDGSALTPNEVRTRARRLAKEHKGELGLIVIDYLQLMRVPGMQDNRVGEISEISRSLKALAKELSCPVVALSQLNRGLEQRVNKRPIMADLRESGAIEQDADLIVFIYRDEVYHPESSAKGVAEIITAKHRNGPTGTVQLTFQGQFLRFANYAHPETIVSAG